MTKRLSILLAVIIPLAGAPWARSQPAPPPPAPAVPAAPPAAEPATPPPDPAAPTASVAEPERTPVAAFTPPKQPDPARYQKLSDPSPFTVRLSATETTEEEPFPDLVLIGYMVLGGKMNAWVQLADAEDPVQLVEGERDPDSGILLVSIKGAEDMFTAEAEIEAQGKKGSLKFTDAGMSITPGAGAAKPVAKTGQPGGQPGQAPQPGQNQAQAAGQAPHGNQPGHSGQQGNRPGQISPTPPGGPGASGSKSPPTTTPRRRIILPN